MKKRNRSERYFNFEALFTINQNREKRGVVSISSFKLFIAKIVEKSVAVNAILTFKRLLIQNHEKEVTVSAISTSEQFSAKITIRGDQCERYYNFQTVFS